MAETAHVQSEPSASDAPSRMAVVNDFVPLADGTARILGRRPPWAARACLFFIALLVAAAVCWAIFSEVDVVIQSEAVLVPFGHTQPVQAPVAGKLTALLVAEGDRVTAGQELARIQSREVVEQLAAQEQAKAALREARRQLDEVFPQRRKLEEEKTAHLEARYASLDALNSLDTKLLAQLKEAYDLDVAAIRSQLAAREAELQNAEKDCGNKEELRRRGFLSEVELSQSVEKCSQLRAVVATLRLDILKADVRYRQNLDDQQKELFRRQQEASQLKADILQTRIGLQAEENRLQQACETAQIRLAEVQRMVHPDLKGDEILIRAPTSGIVTRLVINREGQIVSTGELLLAIGPANSPTVAELKVQNQDIGLVALGQDVKLKYHAFNYRDYGIKQGRVTRISPDAENDQNLGLVYVVTVSLDEDSVMVRGEKKPLNFGLRATAEIVTERRSIARLALAPLRSIWP